MIPINRRSFLETAAAASFLSNQPNRVLASDSPEVGCGPRRQEVLSKMANVMGPFPQKNKPALDLRSIESTDLPNCTRAKITFASEEGDRVPGYLLKPKRVEGKVPGILCLHQTTTLGAGEPAGLGGDANLHYALELAERGYVTLAPCYPDLPLTPGFGGYRFDAYRHGYVSNTMKGIWNHMRAVDLLQSLPEVDPDHIGCIGHSLGGHNTLFVGAFDPRIQVLVTSCGFTSFRKYMGGELSGWAQLRYMPLISVKYHDNPAEMPFDFSDVLTALAPRPVFINAPLHDDNFDVSGVEDTLNLVKADCPREYGAGEKLVVKHPDAAHSFPTEVRMEAYAFLDKWLGRAIRAGNG
jgi:hypothetical protein